MYEAQYQEAVINHLERLTAPQQDKRLMDVKEAAEYLNIPKTHLNGLLAELKFYRFGKFLRFRKRDLDNWLEQHAINKG